MKAHIPTLKKEGKKLRKESRKGVGPPAAIEACFAHINETMAFSGGEQPFLDIGVHLFKTYRTRFFTDAEYMDLRNSYEAFKVRLGTDEARSMHFRQALVKQVVEDEPAEISA